MTGAVFLITRVSGHRLYTRDVLTAACGEWGGTLSLTYRSRWIAEPMASRLNRNRVRRGCGLEGMTAWVIHEEQTDGDHSDYHLVRSGVIVRAKVHEDGLTVTMQLGDHVAFPQSAQDRLRTLLFDPFAGAEAPPSKGWVKKRVLIAADTPALPVADWPSVVERLQLLPSFCNHAFYSPVDVTYRPSRFLDRPCGQDPVIARSVSESAPVLLNFLYFPPRDVLRPPLPTVELPAWAGTTAGPLLHQHGGGLMLTWQMRYCRTLAPVTAHVRVGLPDGGAADEVQGPEFVQFLEIRPVWRHWAALAFLVVATFVWFGAADGWVPVWLDKVIPFVFIVIAYDLGLRSTPFRS